MYPNIWKELFPKSLKTLKGLTLLGSILFSSTTLSQEKEQDTTLGIFETVDKIIKIESKSYRDSLDQLNRNPLVLTSLSDLENVRIEETFVKSILFHSPTKYVDLVADNQCRFYSFLENLLLTRPGYEGRNIPISYRLKNRDLTGVVPFNDFFKFIYKNKCSSNRDIGKLFDPDNVKKTSSAIEYKLPANQSECFQIFSEWRQSDYIAHMCKMAENISLGRKRESQLPSIKNTDLVTKRKFRREILRGKNYSSILGEYKSDYVQHLCENIGNRKRFCEKYLTQSFWKKSLSSVKRAPSLNYKCKLLLNKEEVTKQELSVCADRLTLEENNCLLIGANKFSSVVPYPNCIQQSMALNMGKMLANNYDCPGKIGNSGITNATRLIFHLNQAEVNSKPENCSSMPTKTFLSFLVNNKNQETWKPRICFNDPFNENKESCKQVLLANAEFGEYTEKKIIAEILRKLIRAPRNLDCKTASNKEYNPDRLQWKFGCFLIYDVKNCSSNYCPKTVYYQNKKVDGINYKGRFAFDYFPNVIRDDQKSFAYVLEEARKFRRKSIRSITDLKYYLNLSSTSLVHGVGCLGDLLPEHFPKYRMNQCNPVPFIIDGLREENFRYFVSVRIAIDDLHSPRILSWYNIFNSVRNFHTQQPINHWTLYGAR